MRALALVAVTLLASFAGCLGDDPVGTSGSVYVGPVLSSAMAEAVDRETLRWSGADMTAGERARPRVMGVSDLAECGSVPCPPLDCDATECHRVPFQVDVSGRFWEDHDGFLEVAVRWPTTFEQELRLWIEDADGTVLATGAHSGYSFSVALVAFLERPGPGSYTAVVAAEAANGTHEGVIQVESWPRDAVVRELLPDLVTLPPTDLTFETPSWGAVGPFMFDQTGTIRPLGDLSGSQGCALEEVLDNQPRRCLRFTNAVGNAGEGALEIRLSLQDGATSPTGTGFVQRLYSSDGSFREQKAGATEFHAYHLHFHDAAANLYTVYTYDVATATRGDAIAEGRKTGVCFADVGLIDLGMPATGAAHYSGRGCIDPTGDQDWFMGLDPNWYDAYPWLLTDQFVDIGDAPDGTYQICSVTNQDGVLLEATLDNNEGCTVFRLTGNDIEVLGEEPYHKLVPGGEL